MHRLRVKDIAPYVGDLPPSIHRQYNNDVALVCQQVCKKDYVPSWEKEKYGRCVEKCEDYADDGPSDCLLWIGSRILDKYHIHSIYNMGLSDDNKNVTYELMLTQRNWYESAKTIFDALKKPQMLYYEWLDQYKSEEEAVLNNLSKVALQDIVSNQLQFITCLNNKVSQIMNTTFNING